LGGPRVVVPEYFVQSDDARSGNGGHRLLLATGRELLEAEQERADHAQDHKSFHGSIPPCLPGGSKRRAMDLVHIQSTGFAATPMMSSDRLTERVRGGDDGGKGGGGPGRRLEYAGRPMLARCLILLVLLLGLLSPRPAHAASPTETMETFFEQANLLLRGADRTRGVEETRRAIRQ